MAASVAEDELEYESDPEESKMSLIARRREASDDEDERDERDMGEREERVSESEAEGAVAEYDDESDESGEFDQEEGERDEEVEEGESDVKVVGGELNVEGGVSEFLENKEVVEGGFDGEGGENGKEVVREKEKENEPFAVPTAGVFYMHDDRFRDGPGRGRRHRYDFQL